MVVSALLTAAVLQAPVLYESDFEGGRAEGWRMTRPEAVHVEDTGDAERGKAMRLEASGPWTHALLEGSETWGPVRMEGWVRFPENVHNYLGFIWGYRAGSERTDFASAYVKGNGSYIRVNHRYDGNPTRAMNEERRVELVGDDAVIIGRWQPFAIEVVGTRAHIYFGDLTVPKVTEDLYQGESGAIGLKPRVVGGDVLVDDIRVTGIDGFTYRGASRPAVEYDTAGVITEWQVLGPTVGLHPEVARSREPTAVTVVEDERTVPWRPFRTDGRGAVVTSRVVQFRGEKTRAYFAAPVVVEEGGPDRIVITSIDDLAIWVDGRFQGYYDRDPMIWHDFVQNPQHRGRTLRVQLEPGEHWLVVEVRGALYAGGGFWAGLGPTEGPSAPREPPSMIDALAEPVGWPTAALDSLVAPIARRVASGDIVGAEVLVMKDGRLVLHEAFGWKDREARIPLQRNTIFRLRSMTKPFIAAAVLLLADEGLISVSDPVARHLPEFANERSSHVTIEQLLTHTAGYAFQDFPRPRMEYASLEAAALDVGRAGPSHPPGRYRYSDVGPTVLGALVSRVGGIPVDRFIRVRILRPLGMSDTYTGFAPDSTWADRVASTYRVGATGQIERYWDPSRPQQFGYFRASGGMYGTTTDYARFLSMWLDGGRIPGGGRLLSDSAVAAALRRHPGGHGYHWFVEPAAPGELPVFWADGYDGTLAVVSPTDRLMVLYFTQSGEAARTRALLERVERLGLVRSPTDRAGPEHRP